MKVSTILDQIDDGGIALPEFQRGYVWNRDQVRGLLDSLYRRHPVGGLLVWTTRTENPDVAVKGGVIPSGGTVKLLLDGQQRMTTLYGIIRGKPPRFFQGNSWAFTNLYFHLEDQTFKFYAPLEMKDNPVWINVTELMQQGLGAFVARLPPDRLTAYINRLSRITAIADTDMHIEEVTGEDKTIDVVVDIFNKVNSGGTKLSKGDLALAKVCAEWPAARDQLRARLATWAQAGYTFELEWLLRNITTVLTGQAMFAGLDKVDAASFKGGLEQAAQACNYLLNTVAGRLGLDHDRVLGGRYAFPVMARYVALRQGSIKNAQERDRLLYWYIHAFLWGRFAGSTETYLNQDLRALDAGPAALDRLLDQMRQWRGDLRIRPDDFAGATLGARFYPLLYMLTRVWGAQDWGTGLALSAHLLGKLSHLEVHHIFPKALLYKHGYARDEVNALANFCFLTQDTNLTISDTPPAVYFAQVERDHPGALASQWIPMDRDLWQVDRYRDFLAARRDLLAAAANRFLESLLTGSPATVVADQPDSAPPAVAATVVAPGGVAGEAEEALIAECRAWVVAQGLPAGEYLYELADATTGAVTAILDLAWPRGLQAGLSAPAALLLDEDTTTEEAANRAGYRFFTSIPAFRAYVEREILAAGAPDLAGVGAG